MIHVDSKHPAGTIGVPIGSLARYKATFESLDRLKVPHGTPPVVYAEGVNIAHNCNNLVESMTGEWLWIMGDDHRFRDDLLLKLLDRQVDVVVPITCRRGPPFQTVLYQISALDGSSYMTYSWADLTRDYPDGGLITVDAAGSAGMLIRKVVLDSIKKPWFEWKPRISEDIGFCLKARAAGFGISADLDERMSHLTPCDLEPYRSNAGEWNVAVNIGGRRVSLTNTPFDGVDMREAVYGHKDGLGGAVWNDPAKRDLKAVA
jgi:hypothetical protein